MLAVSADDNLRYSATGFLPDSLTAAFERPMSFRRLVNMTLDHS